jgi:hypothetical protein
MPNSALLGDREKGSLIQRKEAHGSIASEAIRKAKAMEAGDWREAP